MLLPVAEMYHVNSIALLIIISVLVGAGKVTCILTLTQAALQTLHNGKVHGQIWTIQILKLEVR